MRRITATVLACALTASVGAGSVVASVAAASSPTSPTATHAPPTAKQEFPPATAAVLAALANPAKPVVAARVAHLDPALQTGPASGTRNITVRGDVAEVVAAVAKAGGQVLATVPGAVSAVVPHAALVALAEAHGVSAVAQPVRAVELDSEGVAASNAGPSGTAGTWQNAADSGAGVTIGIVDGGFADLASEVTANHLPAGLTVSSLGSGQHGCTSGEVASTQHGTAVTEIVHQMAPAAQLVLYCVEDQVGFQAAEAALQTAGVKIVNSSLGFPGDSRGDGTGAAGSAARTVETARKAGMLWVQSAGNNAQDHWSGILTDTDHDGLIDLDGSGKEVDLVPVLPGGSATFEVQWDQWPTSTADLSVNTVQVDGGTGDVLGSAEIGSHAAGTAPVAGVCVNPGGTDGCYALGAPDSTGHVWYAVAVGADSAPPAVRYDLSYWGDVDASYLSTVSPARAAAGSITEPASSPYALAVGAADVGADGTAAGTLEPFSSQGPTIDQRVKPDVTGWDGVSSYLSEFSSGFYGTSASAPHVAGAAALVAAANPSMDASQIQNFLEQRASGGAPSNPPTNAEGHGLLTLGSTPTQVAVAPPAGTRYQPVTPVRLVDTRVGKLPAGAKGALPAGRSVTIAVPGLPSDATAVAINLTGIGAAGSTFLSVYPAGSAWPGTSNLNLASADPTAAVFAIVAVHGGRFTIRNNAANVNVAVDELGYFGTGPETGRYTALAPSRVLDTRTSVGGHRGALPKAGTVSVDPGLPSGATAAVVNVTAVPVSGAGSDLSAAASCTHSSSTLNFSRYARANLAVVGLSSGRFCIANDAVAVNVVVDVVGYLSSSGAQYYPLPAPQRIVDTRDGNGGAAGGQASAPLGPNASKVFTGDVPAGATALLTGVVEASSTQGGYLTLFAGSTAPSAATSSLNFTVGRVVSNAAIAGLQSTLFGVYNNRGNVQAAVDLFGYFAP